MEIKGPPSNLVKPDVFRPEKKKLIPIIKNVIKTRIADMDYSRKREKTGEEFDPDVIEYTKMMDARDAAMADLRLKLGIKTPMKRWDEGFGREGCDDPDYGRPSGEITDIGIPDGKTTDIDTSDSKIINIDIPAEEEKSNIIKVDFGSKK